MQYALSVMLHNFNFNQIKRNNQSVIASATEYFSSSNNSVWWTPQKE